MRTNSPNQLRSPLIIATPDPLVTQRMLLHDNSKKRLTRKASGGVIVNQESTAGFNIDLRTSNESSQEDESKLDYNSPYPTQLLLGGRDSATTDH